MENKTLNKFFGGDAHFFLKNKYSIFLKKYYSYTKDV